MEQSLPLSGSDVPRKASVRQTIAAVIFVVELVWGVLNPYLGIYLRQTFEIGPTISVAAVFSAMNAVSLLLLAAGYALLISGAANRATKTALVLLVSLQVAGILLYGAEIFFWQYSSVPFVFWLLFTFSEVYAFSVILRGNELDRNTVSWIGLFIVGECMSIVFRLMHGVSGADWIELNETGFGLLTTLFQVVWVVLLIVASVRFARCAAFSGAGAPAPADVWSPVNRYMAAAIVAPAVTLLALWALFRVVAPGLSSL